MNFEYVRETYNMPWLHMGVHVLALGKHGIVNGASHYVHVRLVGESHTKRYHPDDVKPYELPAQVNDE